VIKNADVCKRIQKRIGTWSSHMTEDEKALGYSCGKWFVLHLESTCEEFTVKLICTKSTFERLTLNAEEFVEVKKLETKFINGYERLGSYAHVWYKKRRFELDPSIQPMNHQQAVIDCISEHRMHKNQTVVFIHGAPGSGKSMVALLLAQKLEASYCNTLKPWQPGDSLWALHSEIEPSFYNPLIIVFEEIDVVLTSIHIGIPPHKNLPIQCPNKNGWNTMFDTIQRGLFPHLIIIMTSNKSPEEINMIDESFIRKNRVNIISKI
jgi:hypothetical protein